jgi:hypothetical protein
MHRLLLLIVVLAIVACAPADHTESGAITAVADDAKQARSNAQDAVSAIEAAARRDEAASQVQPDGDKH